MLRLLEILARIPFLTPQPHSLTASSWREEDELGQVAGYVPRWYSRERSPIPVLTARTVQL